MTVTMAPPAVSLRALIRELPYRDALRVVALMNNASDRQPRSDSPALAADPEARAIAIDSEEREAAWQALVWDERHDNCGLSAERPRPSCPACGSSALYVRGGLADPGNGDDAGPVRRSPVYLECAGCGAWSWPPREPETTWRLQHALRGGLTPNAAVGRGDVVALAALAFERFPWDQLDLVVDGVIGISDYVSCSTGGCPARRPDGSNAFYCDRCKEVRKKAQDAARYQERKAAEAGEVKTFACPRSYGVANLGRRATAPRTGRLPCCEEYGKQCPWHEAERETVHQRVVFSPAERAMLLGLFQPYGGTGDKKLADFGTGRDARMRNQFDNPNRGPDEGRTGMREIRPSLYLFTRLDPADDSEAANVVRSAQHWLKAHDRWWPSPDSEKPCIWVRQGVRYVISR